MREHGQPRVEVEIDGLYKLVIVSMLMYSPP